MSDAFQMKGLRKVTCMRVSWTAKKTNEWVLNEAGVKRELLDTVDYRESEVDHALSNEL